MMKHFIKHLYIDYETFYQLLLEWNFWNIKNKKKLMLSYKYKIYIIQCHKNTSTIPTLSFIFNFLFRWKESRSQSWAVSTDVVIAYLPDEWTDMECIADWWPFIIATNSLVSTGTCNKTTNRITVNRVQNFRKSRINRYYIKFSGFFFRKIQNGIDFIKYIYIFF